MERSIIFLNGENIGEMTIAIKAIHRFSAIFIKLPKAFFTELEQENLQFVWKH